MPAHDLVALLSFSDDRGVLSNTRLDYFPDEAVGQTFANRKADRAFALIVSAEFLLVRSDCRTAHREKGAVLLRRAECHQQFPIEPKCRNLITDTFDRFRRGCFDSPSKLFQCASLICAQLRQVIVNVFRLAVHARKLLSSERRVRSIELSIGRWSEIPTPVQLAEVGWNGNLRMNFRTAFWPV